GRAASAGRSGTWRDRRQPGPADRATDSTLPPIRQPHSHSGAAATGALDRPVATEFGGPLPHRPQPGTGRFGKDLVGELGDANAIIDNLDEQVAVAPNANCAATGTGMPGHVCQCLT